VPLAGAQLPLVKTMIAVTFVAGLLPVIGNLISNTVIVVVSLSVSPVLAASSLLFLVVIHKLEYFVNARVMGGQIHARAWEFLVAMLGHGSRLRDLRPCCGSDLLRLPEERADCSEPHLTGGSGARPGQAITEDVPMSAL
jgi:hypothetical protein